MKKIFWSLFLFLIFSTLQTGGNSAFSIEEKSIIKVGISNNSFSTYEHNKMSFISKEPLSIVNMEQGGKIEVEADKIIEIKAVDNLFEIRINGRKREEKFKGTLVLTSTGAIGIMDLKRKGCPAFYSGMVELKTVKPDKFNTINVLDMQTYLKGVIPNEMPVSFGLEALKAQAVAARNYANRPNTTYKNYDICDSTACQVYYGANSQTEISDRAVDETRGIYALYDKEIILALYSSTPGGITEDYFNTFGNFSENKPYLKSVKDSENISTKDLEDYFKNPVPSFDMKSPRYRWNIKFDRLELEEILTKNLLEQSKTGNVFPKFVEGNKIYDLQEIKVLKRGESKKALAVEIKSKGGNYVVAKELPIRRTFKKDGKILPSANFIVERGFLETVKEENKAEPEEEVIFQEEEVKKPKKELPSDLLPAQFTFFGAGFGHGVGLSQYGAGFLAGYGVSYDNILKHYYRGIELGTVPKTVSYNNLGINYTQDFYFEKKHKVKAKEQVSKSPLKEELEALLKNTKHKCTLVIENPDRASKIEFFINDFYFSPEIEGFNKKVLKTDITEYLKEGENKITFKPLKEEDKKKTVKFYITMEDIDE